jgi:hypothetical protein
MGKEALSVPASGVDLDLIQQARVEVQLAIRVAHRESQAHRRKERACFHHRCWPCPAVPSGANSTLRRNRIRSYRF